MKSFTWGSKKPRVLVLPVGGIGPFREMPSPMTNLRPPPAFWVIPSMVMGPSLILNSTEAPLPGLP
ncbi:hypothetical protein D3C72_2389480 [compost metagenome]